LGGQKDEHLNIAPFTVQKRKNWRQRKILVDATSTHQKKRKNWNFKLAVKGKF